MLRDTKNPLPVEARRVITETLEQLVYDGGDLYGVVKTAHWNLRGSTFLPLHEFLGKVAGHVEKIVDAVAERAVQLGCHADGSVKEAAKCSRLPGFSMTSFMSGDDDVARGMVARRLALFAGYLRVAAQEAWKVEDDVTADLLAKARGKVEEDLWKLEVM